MIVIGSPSIVSGGESRALPICVVCVEGAVGAGVRSGGGLASCLGCACCQGERCVEGVWWLFVFGIVVVSVAVL